MEEKNIKYIINMITRQHGYLLENIKSEDNNSELWTVSKVIDGTNHRLIFITLSSMRRLLLYNIPDDKDNIYILLSEDDSNSNSEQIRESIVTNRLLDKPLIRINISEKKVNYSEKVNLQVVKDIASVMSNNNLKGSNEKIDIKDRPWITIGIISINIMMYLVTAYMSYSSAAGSIINSDTNVLILLGAKVNTLIAQGQYYRLVTCMFLHGGIVHLGVNMYSLYAIGPMVERVYGKVKYITIYFIAGICASIFSYIFSTSVSIGASGAIFGLLGAVLIFAIKSKGKTGNSFIRSILSVIFINIFIGATLPNIDNFAHVGGLLGGMIIAYLVNFKEKN